MVRKSTAKGVLGLLRNPAVGGLVAIGLFEVLLRLRVPSEAAAVVLGVTMFPALVIGLAGRVGDLAHERASHAATLWLAFADVAIAVCFFAFLYLELGIYAAGDPGRDVSSYLTCLYFSASTLTNAGWETSCRAPRRASWRWWR